MLAGSMPNSVTPAWLVETATKCLATASSPLPRPSSSQARAARALVNVSWVVNVLEQTDEQGRGRVEVVGLGIQVDRVDVRDEPALDGGVGVVAQRLVGHGRPEVRSADADVHDRPDPLPGVPGPGPRADPLGHRSHGVEHGVHVGHHVPAVDLQLLRRAACAGRRGGRTRSSVVLIRSPANMASRRSATPARRATAISAARAPASTRCFE